MTHGVKAAWDWGPCPKAPEPVGETFSIDDYAGNWYEILRDETVWYEAGTECVTASYAAKPEQWIWDVQVNNRRYKRDKDEVTNSIIFGDYTFSNARCDDIGNCKVKFLWYPEGNYQVLDYDKDSYSLVYGCDNWFLGIFHTNQAWLLSRTTTASQEIIDQAKATLAEKVGLDTYDYETLLTPGTQGDSCKYGI